MLRTSVWILHQCKNVFQRTFWCNIGRTTCATRVRATTNLAINWHVFLIQDCFVGEGSYCCGSSPITHLTCRITDELLTATFAQKCDHMTVAVAYASTEPTSSNWVTRNLFGLYSPILFLFSFVFFLLASPFSLPFSALFPSPRSDPLSNVGLIS